ncbi:MAG: ribosome-associated translation inhibitor RaiA [Candidatus Babeliales bacterium]
MDKKITFRQMEHSDVMEKYINGQLAKIEQFLTHEREPIFIELVLEPVKIHAHHRVELRVKTPDYYLISNYEGPEFYDVIDRVIDVMYRQLCEKKRELVDDKRSGNADWYKGA